MCPTQLRPLQVDWNDTQQGYPQPQYDSRQQNEYQRAAQAHLEQQRQQQQQQRSHLSRGCSRSSSPFAQAGTQQVVLGATGGAAAAAAGPGMAEACASDSMALPNMSAVSNNSSSNSRAMPQVLNVSSGQVLKVTSGEFQDILTVMKALAGMLMTEKAHMYIGGNQGHALGQPPMLVDAQGTISCHHQSCVQPRLVQPACI
jgi:hypothetical protein